MICSENCYYNAFFPTNAIVQCYPTAKYNKTFSNYKQKLLNLIQKFKRKLQLKGYARVLIGISIQEEESRVSYVGTTIFAFP